MFFVEKSASRLNPLISNLARYTYRSLVTGVVTGISLVTQTWLPATAQAQTQAYCQFTPEAIAEKNNLRQAAIKGNSDAQNNYKTILKKHQDWLTQCRKETWPQTQAIWLRLYPCDARPGAIEAILDEIVNKGYNQVNVEVFFDSQVLLPVAENNTPWVSVLRDPGTEKIDLLAEAIKKGRERGLKVYAWLFTMNFGYAYAQRPDRQAVLARNGKGQDSLSFVHDGSQAFIDPYNRQAQIDYYKLVQAVAARQPDGILFDYIRYPRGSGSQSVVGNVKDLWIYGNAAQQALFQRAQNNQGRLLIERYVNQGYLNIKDIEEAQKLYPQEQVPLWQGRTPAAGEKDASLSFRRQQLQLDLWYLSVAHAAQGVIDFLNLVSTPAKQRNIPAGAVFFPTGNQVIGEIGFDSRLQAWDRFPASIQWHPMSYAVCGTPDCIVEEVKRVVSMSEGQTQIIPALAGWWGKSYDNRPSLEAQMQAIQRAFPQIKGVSHFAYSWQEPESDKQRRFCRLP